MTATNPGAITYKARVIEVSGEAAVIERSASPTGVPGLGVGEAYLPCPARADEPDWPPADKTAPVGSTRPAPCWIVVHLRSGRVFQFCWHMPAEAVEFAGTASEFGPWDIDEAAVDRRMNLPFVRQRLHEAAMASGAFIHRGPTGPSGIDNPVGDGSGR